MGLSLVSLNPQGVCNEGCGYWGQGYTRSERVKDWGCLHTREVEEPVTVKLAKVVFWLISSEVWGHPRVIIARRDRAKALPWEKKRQEAK